MEGAIHENKDTLVGFTASIKLLNSITSQQECAIKLD